MLASEMLRSQAYAARSGVCCGLVNTALLRHRPGYPPSRWVRGTHLPEAEAAPLGSLHDPVAVTLLGREEPARLLRLGFHLFSKSKRATPETRNARVAGRTHRVAGRTLNSAFASKSLSICASSPTRSHCGTGRAQRMRRARSGVYAPTAMPYPHRLHCGALVRRFESVPC